MQPSLDEQIQRIKNDLAYYERAVATMGVGGQPPTIYAAKYIEDVQILLSLIPNVKHAPQVEAPKSQLEIALAHDTAARTERRPRKP